MQALVSVPSANSYKLTEVKSSAESGLSSGNAESSDIPQRTSELSSPTLQLRGHKGFVHTVQFSADGQILASGDSTGTLYLWTVFGENAPDNYEIIPAHKNNLLQLCWSGDSNQYICTASADKAGGVVDVSVGVRLKALRHRSYVNAVAATRSANPLVLTGSDDKTAALWDIRVKEPVMELPHAYAVTAVALSADAQSAYTGGIDEIIRAFDLRYAASTSTSSASSSSSSSSSSKVLFELKGHKDTITGLSLNVDGTALASNAMDGTVRTWDVRRFLGQDRALAGREINDLTGYVCCAIHHSCHIQYHQLLSYSIPSADILSSDVGDIVSCPPFVCIVIAVLSTFL